MTTSQSTEAFEAALGYTFRDRALLETALTHRSYGAEHRGAANNEVLEFLGDSVLGLAITDFIVKEHPGLPEGNCARLRASLVSKDALVEVGQRVGIGLVLRLGVGEDGAGGRSKPKIVANAMEAVFGAVYTDGGFDAASAVIRKVFEPQLAVLSVADLKDFKTQLQEQSIVLFGMLPRYSATIEGPDHKKWFKATVTIDGTAYGTGEGSTKRVAEQKAAEEALKQLADM